MIELFVVSSGVKVVEEDGETKKCLTMKEKRHVYESVGQLKNDWNDYVKTATKIMTTRTPRSYRVRVYENGVHEQLESAFSVLIRATDEELTEIKRFAEEDAFNREKINEIHIRKTDPDKHLYGKPIPINTRKKDS